MPFDFACPDWVERLEQGRPPFPDLDLNEAAAAKAIGVYDNLRLPDVPGQPRLAEAGADWFRSLVGAAFGSDDPVTGERRVGEIFCLVPKKNSKTTNSAALGLTALLLNTVPNAEMLVVGPTKDVAQTCFNQAKGMIEADDLDPETGESYLQNRFHVVDGALEIHDRLTGASLKIKSFDARVLTGKIPILVIVDELHVLGSSPKTARVLAQIRGGMITRPNTLLLFITTQSDDVPAGAFKSELEYARKVRDGKVKGGNVLACLYELPEAIQNPDKKLWRDPKYWPMVLPNLGKSITLERLARLYALAVEKGPEDEATFASQHLNVQVGMGLLSGRWVGVDHWPVGTARMSLDEILAASEVVTIGIDGGGLDDLFGLAIIGRDRITKHWRGWARAWVHPVALEKRKDITPRLLDFRDQGDLVICDDPTADLREVAGLCAEIQSQGLLPAQYAIGLDPYGVTALQQEMAAHGLGGELLSAIPQGSALSPAIWGIERKLNDGTFQDAGQPLLDWSVSNAKVEQRGNAVMITKAVSGRAKIDPLMALFNAAALMGRNPEAAGGGLDEFLAAPVMVV